VASSTYSGKTNVRLGPALHAHLAKLATQQGLSLNQLIVTLLAGGSNFTLPEK
jgi:predicted HicB family RNase H-like nuclease